MFQNYTEYVQKNTPEPAPQPTAQQQQQIAEQQRRQVHEQFLQDCIARLAKNFADAGIGYEDAENILRRTIRTLQLRILTAPVPDGNIIATAWAFQFHRLEQWTHN